MESRLSNVSQGCPAGTKLRVAVVGAGRLGGFHAQKLAGFDDVELIGVVDPFEANRQRVAAATAAPGYADFRPLLGRLDAAVIASPTKLHHELAAELIAQGVHVLVEKPLCSTQAEADRLVALARQHEVTLQVGHVERFNPAFAAAAPSLAEPKYIEAVRTSPYSFRSTDVGVVLDVMIHDIDLVLSLVDSPVRHVEAVATAVVGPHEDATNARLEFESGCVATLSASRVSYETIRRMQVWTPRRFAAIDFAARTATTVNPSKTLLRGQFVVDGLSPEALEYHKQHFAAEHLPVTREEFAAVDALTLELRDFVDSIRQRRRPRVDGAAGRNALAVAEAILEQSRRHDWNGRRELAPAASLAPPLVALAPASAIDDAPAVIPAPHFRTDPSHQHSHRRAG